MPKSLSIIIPVYKVEKYIRSCVMSVFRQGLEDNDYELILVDDGTPDRSIEQISDLLILHSNIKVIHQDNSGLPAARNRGLSEATGEYVFFLDSDDVLTDNALSLLLEKASMKNADLSMADFITLTDKDIDSLQDFSFQKGNLWTEKTGRQLLIEDQNPGFGAFTVWHTLYRHSFLKEHNIRFVPGISYAEDFPFTHECCLRAKLCLKTDLVVTIYRQRTSQMTSCFTERNAMDYAKAIGLTWALRKSISLSTEDFDKLKFNVSDTYLWMIHMTLTYIKGVSRQIHALNYLVNQTPGLSITKTKLNWPLRFLYSISPRLLLLLWVIKHYLYTKLRLLFHHTKG